MIEGQEDVSWPQWVALAQACEEHGVGTLFRSDHYLSVEGRQERGSLETWATLAGLAAVTTRLRLGVLVSPATFRHPSVLAKLVTAADHISNGRDRARDRRGLERARARGLRLRVPSRSASAWSCSRNSSRSFAAPGRTGPFSFAGKHYRLVDLDAQPKPVQRPHPPVIIGGGAKPRTARLAARLADEYNTVYATPAECAERRAVVEAAWRDAGRDPATMTFSVMVPWVSGSDAADLRAACRRLAEWRGTDAESMLGEFAGLGVTGTFDESLARMREYRDAGVDRIMLQHLLHDDVEAIGLLARLAAAVG